ncbi:hypothetical protein ACERK3_04955 [Phycisphaerales bacterium AB-hyl4]|uniref:Uncharacterized protein n=1 Tax=Natronomicrosphaera hydrolytica TaxID=3242702 RepID=A0ABV4U581_9BACT
MAPFGRLILLGILVIMFSHSQGRPVTAKRDVFFVVRSEEVVTSSLKLARLRFNNCARFEDDRDIAGQSDWAHDPRPTHIGHGQYVSAGMNGGMKILCCVFFIKAPPAGVGVIQIALTHQPNLGRVGQVGRVGQEGRLPHRSHGDQNRQCGDRHKSLVAESAKSHVVPSFCDGLKRLMN